MKDLSFCLQQGTESKKMGTELDPSWNKSAPHQSLHISAEPDQHEREEVDHQSSPTCIKPVACCCCILTVVIAVLIIMAAFFGATMWQEQRVYQAILPDALCPDPSDILYPLAPAALCPAFPPASCCPDDWIGYRGKCYYFSKQEKSWDPSQSVCSFFNASLAEIDSHEAMAFLMRYKGLPDHWIGLRREPEQPWRWTDGSEFNSLFEVRGKGDCAYLNEKAASATRCSTPKNWICSKPVGTVAREGNAVRENAKD
uniref:C-type lectin domain-containing protein n=1 Tax=Sphenodon punctatus TaxID=8508 RepID=A0A8D0GKI7_SPHPU